MNKFRKIVYVAIWSLTLLFLSNNLCFGNTEESSLKIHRHFVAEVVPMNLEEITASADRIFVGNCVSIEEIEDDPASKLPVVKYTFEITEGIKGVENKSKISFKQWAPSIKESGYQKDKKYVLFLYPDSERGLTSPVGLLQGNFEVELHGLIRKKEFVRNKINNRGLSRNLRSQKAVYISNDDYLNNYLSHCSEFAKPMRYREFIRTIKYLAKK